MHIRYVLRKQRNHTRRKRQSRYNMKIISGNSSLDMGGHSNSVSIKNGLIYDNSSKFFNINTDGFLKEDMPSERGPKCRFLDSNIADPVNGAQVQL
jgi:hypothetical protein